MKLYVEAHLELFFFLVTGICTFMLHRCYAQFNCDTYGHQIVATDLVLNLVQCSILGTIRIVSMGTFPNSKNATPNGAKKERDSHMSNLHLQ